MAVLSSQEVDARLRGLSGWQRDDGEIHKRFQFKAFRDAVRFVDAVANLAEAKDHHPDMCVNYNKVTMTLSTHSEGGVTEKDLDMAVAIDGANSFP